MPWLLHKVMDDMTPYVGAQLRWGVASDCGPHRKTNEDALLAEPPVFVVADGMGGHAAGDVASWTAVAAFADLVDRQDVSVTDTVGAVEAANASILQAASLDSAMAGMGTTVAGLVLVDVGGTDHWFVFNVGDSRVYRLTDAGLIQITVDHSELQEMIDATKSGTRVTTSRVNRNVITKSLGMTPAPFPDSWIFPMQPNERFLLCSDGLTRELTDQVIQKCLLQAADPADAARELVELAIAAGGHDNVTVIVVDSSRNIEPALSGDTLPRGVSHG